MTPIRQRVEERWSEIERLGTIGFYSSRDYPSPIPTKESVIRVAETLSQFTPRVPQTRPQYKKKRGELDKLIDQLVHCSVVIERLGARRRRQFKAERLLAELDRVRDAVHTAIDRLPPEPPWRPGGFAVSLTFQMKKEAARLTRDLMEEFRMRPERCQELSAIVFYAAFNRLSGGMRGACDAVKNERQQRRRAPSASR
jgi:hypothetical protein